MKKIVVLKLILLAALYSQVNAFDYSERTGIGSGYSYISLKHEISERTVIEGRVNYVSGISAVGGRLYRINSFFLPLLFNSYIGISIFRQLNQTIFQHI